MARAAAQRLEQAEQAEPKRKKAQEPLLDLSFLQIPKAVSAPRVQEDELQRYVKLAASKHKQGPSWRDFLVQVLQSPLPGTTTIDDYIRAAVTARPIPVEKEEGGPHTVKEMVASRVPGETRLNPDAVRDAIRLATFLESGRINFKKDWCEQVV